MKLGRPVVGGSIAMVAVIGLALLSVPATLLGHDLFIKLDTYFLTPNGQVTIPIYNGTFEKSENSITVDRVLDVSVVAHGERDRVGTARWLAGENNYTTYLTIDTGDPGTYAVGASTAHRDFELAAADFNSYLESDGIPDVLEARRRDGELEVDARERYAKHVKAIVQVGDRASDDFGAVLGYPAEIVPRANPYELGPGDELRVLCLVDGAPVANQLVLAGGLGSGGAIDETAARTGETGEAAFLLSEPGRWYVKFIHMAKLGSDAEVDYESKWATLTFEVR